MQVDLAQGDTGGRPRPDERYFHDFGATLAAVRRHPARSTCEEREACERDPWRRPSVCSSQIEFLPHGRARQGSPLEALERTPLCRSNLDAGDADSRYVALGAGADAVVQQAPPAEGRDDAGHRCCPRLRPRITWPPIGSHEISARRYPSGHLRGQWESPCPPGAPWLLPLFLKLAPLSGHWLSTFLVGAGAACAVLCVFIAARMRVVDSEGHPVHLVRGALTYFPWLWWEIAKSAWAVSKFILNPRLPISPTMTQSWPPARTPSASRPTPIRSR